MGKNFVIYFFIFVVGIIGSYIPLLWGDSLFSVWSVILSGVGGFVGIYVGFKLNKIMGN
ncbi:MAG: hypothetical protein ACNFW9_00935 [Candidatus Kerfeldbacteria bacterium]